MVSHISRETSEMWGTRPSSPDTYELQSLRETHMGVGRVQRVESRTTGLMIIVLDTSPSSLRENLVDKDECVCLRLLRSSRYVRSFMSLLRESAHAIL